MDPDCYTHGSEQITPALVNTVNRITVTGFEVTGTTRAQSSTSPTTITMQAYTKIHAHANRATVQLVCLLINKDMAGHGIIMIIEPDDQKLCDVQTTTISQSSNPINSHRA